ncbi:MULTISPECIES: thiol peroxidase [Myroides]|uniref:Thiol peroxidase n=1 Tax=Myroides albus TaxID=2562892 RepID=A0A6I3LLV8_9FLAO|nr:MULTISPECIES: thiol peroxidase [Myroides]MTG98280.1 thiol peroxidase [Myroides albus]MVX37207.1 thiol peroxidase [Myroides sp. LoEW2-1]UVD78994.1 thiol peroxidase [Myroides albus]
MAKVTLKNNEVHTIGELPAINAIAPAFNLVGAGLADKSLSDYKGKRVILNIFPSVDTGTCAMSVRHFNESAAKLDNAVVLCISRDLPFAQDRFCGAEGIKNVEMLSDFREGQFGKDYGVLFTDGPLKGLLSRAVVIIDPQGKVVYTEQVAETTNEPNYEKALAALK